jgi:hypothetical protein
MSAAPALRHPDAPPPVRVLLADILAVTCEYYGISAIDVRSARRGPKLIAPRHMSFYLAERRFEYSSAVTGKFFNRDRTGVTHAAVKVAASLGDPRLARTANELEIAVLARARARQRGFAHQQPDIDPGRVAQRIVEGGQRAALSTSTDEIMAMAEALSRLEHQREQEQSNV